MAIRQVCVIGAGQMGRGIAQVCATAGYSVKLWDSQSNVPKEALKFIEGILQKGVEKGKVDLATKEKTLTNLKAVDQFQDAVQGCDLVIEAIVENFNVKVETFKKIRETNPNCIVASNTSSISITKMASAAKLGERFVGMHFMNPVPIMKLVEVIRGYSTSHETTETIMQLSKSLNKIPVKVNDYPGFVANRILMPMINEAIIALHEGVGGVEEIDTVMKLGMAHPMGPLQLADFIGLDVCLSILNVLKDGFGNSKYSPCPLLVNMVNARHLGVKSGNGFYAYKTGTKELVVAEQFR